MLKYHTYVILSHTQRRAEVSPAADKTIRTRQLAARFNLKPTQLRRILRSLPEYRDGVRTDYVWREGDPEIARIEAVVNERQRVRKHRKTFTLSGESIDYLEQERRTAHSASTSAVLEKLIREKREEREREKIAAATTRYYDSLSDGEVERDASWGRFAESQMDKDLQ